MALEYLIHCDESTSKGEYFSNFYGGALVRSIHYESVVRELSQLKNDLNFFGEVKWQKVTDTYLGKYLSLIDGFFDMIEQDRVKIRIMFS
jgi:hypothetical protein